MTKFTVFVLYDCGVIVIFRLGIMDGLDLRLVIVNFHTNILCRKTFFAFI